MRHLTASSFIDKSKLRSKHAFVPLFEVSINNDEVTLYFTNWADNIEYQGNEYIGGNFDFSLKSTANKLPVGNLSCFDPSGQLHQLLEKHHGAINSKVTIKIVNTGSLDQNPEFAEFFNVGKTSSKSGFVSFELTVPNYVAARFPPRQTMRNFCGWIFKSPECGYTGPKTTCDYSLRGDNGCIAHENESNFGGFPSI